MVSGFGFRVSGFGFMFRVCGLRFAVWGERFRVQGISGSEDHGVPLGRGEWEHPERIHRWEPMSSEHGTCQTVKARFWPWLSGTGP